jgi:hypothetical protein
MLAYMNNASNRQNTYPAFWRRSRLAPRVHRNNFLLLSSPLTTAIGTLATCQRELRMSASAGRAEASQFG